MAGMMAFDLSTRLIILLLAVQNLYLGLGQVNAWSTNIFSNAVSHCYMDKRLWRSQMERAPDGGTKMPCVRSSLLTLSCHERERL